MELPAIFTLRLAVLAVISFVTPAHAVVTTTDSFGSGGTAVSMDFVTIGNPGNTADTTGAPNPAGSVAKTYRMGTYEVSRDMVSKANTAGALGITLADMTGFGGNGANRPATGISWNEAARFVNSLNVTSGSTAAYKFSTQPVNDVPLDIVEWYAYAKWILEWVESFPKSQRFILGQRLSNHVMDVLETLVKASYTKDKTALLIWANEGIEMTRWVVRMASDRKLLAPKQFEFSALQLNECGRMVGGWLKSRSSTGPST